MSDLLSKFAKQKVTVPSAPRLLCRGACLARGGGYADLPTKRGGGGYVVFSHIFSPAWF